MSNPTGNVQGQLTRQLCSTFLSQRRPRVARTGLALQIFVMLGLLFLLNACGVTSGSGGSTTASISPSSASVSAGGTVKFTPTVTGASNTNVNWSVSGASCTGTACGTISPTSTASGAPATYTAPATVSTTETVTITATAAANSSVAASATVTITVATGSCHVGPPYTSYSGTAVIPNLSPAPIPAAVGMRFVEPEFGPYGQNQIVRVTDANTASLLGISKGDYSVSSGSEENRWAYDDTHFEFDQTGTGQWIVYTFDPNCADANYMSVAPDTNWNSGSAIATTELQFSPYAGPGGDVIAYGVNGTQFLRFDHNHTAGTTSQRVLFDVSTDPSIPALAGGGFSAGTITWDQDGSEAHVGNANLSGDSKTGQDNWDIVIVCDKAASGCRWWKTCEYVSGVCGPGPDVPAMGGDYGPSCSPSTTPCPFSRTFPIHSSLMNHRTDGVANDGYILVTAQASFDTQAIWQFGTTNVGFCTSGGVCGGHTVLGTSSYYQHYACVGNSFCAANNDDRSWLVRPFAGSSLSSFGNGPTAGFEYNPPSPTSTLGEDGHETLVLGESYLYDTLIPQYTAGCSEYTAWQCESLAITNDPNNYGHEIVYRFIHHYNYINEQGTGGNFFAAAKPIVSPDGKFLMFVSDWYKTLLNPDGTTRYDIFIHEMK